MAANRGLPAGTVTFLFARAGGSDEGLEGAAAALAGRGGVEVERGLVAFASAGSAVDAAVALQREGGGACVALHTGEGDEAVGQAPRLGALAHPGQILLSPTTAALVEHELRPGTRLRDLGETPLPGGGRREHLFQVMADGLQADFPPLVPPAPRPAAEPARPPLLERETELASMDEHLDTAASGAGRLVAIEGRAGMGKTRLLAEARAAGLRRGLTVLIARGGELEHEFAFGVVRQLFEPLLATATSAERNELLAGPAAQAAALFEIAELPEGEGREGVSLAILHALYWLAANLSLRRPTLLAIDDLHWADAPSLRWLLHLQRRLDGLPLLVVAATRPPVQAREEQLVTEILADPATSLLEPSALGQASVTVLARGVFGSDPAPEFVAACHEATGGNPLFLEALLETLGSDGLEPTAANAARVFEIGPEPVGRVVSLRLSRVPAPARQLARAVAVLGGYAQAHHAAALAGLDLDGTTAAAETLARTEILRPGLPLEFMHPVVRQVVYDDLPWPERLAAHRRAADVLAEASAEPEQVAVHLEQAEPSGDPFVVATLRRAADRALQRGASELAVGFLRRALAEPPAPEHHAEVLRALGLAERLVGNDAAIVHLREALDALDRPARAGRVALELGRALQQANRHGEAIEALQRGRELVQDNADMANSLTAELIGASWWDPEDLPFAEAELAKARAMELDESYGAQLLRATLAYAEARVGDDRAYALGLARAAMTSGLLVSTGSRALYSLAYVFVVAGETEVSIALYDGATEEALRRGDYVLASGCVLFRAIAHLSEGNLAAAEEDVVRVPELAELQMGTPYHAAFGAWAAIERGDLDEAERRLAVTGFGERLPPLGQFMYVHLMRGRLRLERRELDAAIDDLLTLAANSRALGHRNPAFMPWQPYAALALHGADRTAEGVEILVEALEQARTWSSPSMTGVLLRTLGLLEGGTSGEARLLESVDLLAGTRARLEYARSLVELGAALRRGNRRSDSRDHLRAGLELAHLLGATTLEERARTELTATGARPRRFARSGADSLTPSERRIAEMAAENMTNKEIAQALYVTPKTVEVHLSSAYRKLGISSRSQLRGALAPAAG